jgi:uncharacterized protein
MAAEEVSFYQDDGLRLAADAVLPDGVPAGGVVICPGFRGGRRGGSGMAVAERLAADLGWVALLLDYSGFGGSEGPRGRFDPERQVADIRAAVAYLRVRLAGGPVAVYGNSFGAGMASVAAARDPAVACLFSLCAFSSGRALMAEQRPWWQLVEFTEALDRDRLERVAIGRSREVDADFVMPRDPEAAAYKAKLVAAGRFDESPMPLADAQRLVDFEPLRDAARLRGRPALFVHCERDHWIPARHSQSLAEAAGARCLLLPYGHYDIYEGAPQELLLRTAVDFYRGALSA